MDIVACKMCRKPFQSYGNPICHQCLDAIDENFVKIRDYMYDHPGNWGADHLAEATEVPKAHILHMIQTGRLTVKDGSGGGTEKVCGSCKKPIASGQLCEDCRNQLASQLTGTLPKQEKADQSGGSTRGSASNRPRMHVDHRKDKG